MRALRAFLFLCVGLILGAGTVAAFAANPYGPSINFNYPGGINAPRRAGGPIYDFQSAPNGWGAMRDINKLSIGGRTWDFVGTRNFSPGALARSGVGLARGLGPLGIGLTLAPLIWDAAEGWLIDAPREDVPPYDEISGYWYKSGSACNSGADQCSLSHAVEAAAFDLANNYELGAGYVVTGGEFIAPDRFKFFYDILATGGTVSRTFYVYRAANNGYCPEDYTLMQGVCISPAERRPATDSEIEDAIRDEIVSKQRGSDLLRRLVENGYTPDVDSATGTGPTTIPGTSTTSTTSGPGGNTTVVTNTTHNVTYNTNTTNNTTTVTITNNVTTTTTHPDGTTTTETTTETPPESGQETQEEQYTLTYSPSAMPEVPDFYEQKYPDGFAGAWDEFRGRVAASSLAGFINGIGAGLPGGGTCPSWSMSLNMGAMGNFGTFVLEPPCVIWPFIKAVMILSALFVARRLVVGG